MPVKRSIFIFWYMFWGGFSPLLSNAFQWENVMKVGVILNKTFLDGKTGQKPQFFLDMLASLESTWVLERVVILSNFRQ